MDQCFQQYLDPSVWFLEVDNQHFQKDKHLLLLTICFLIEFLAPQTCILIILFSQLKFFLTLPTCLYNFSISHGLLGYIMWSIRKAQILSNDVLVSCFDSWSRLCGQDTQRAKQWNALSCLHCSALYRLRLNGLVNTAPLPQELF